MRSIGLRLDLAVNNVYTNGMKENRAEDPSMVKVKSLFEKSGLTMNDLGLKMGYPPETARQSVFQFMKAGDPHVSMLRRFAKAMDVTLADLLDENQKSRSK
jgi:transcriptional regulator with XRE-family HTH domain